MKLKYYLRGIGIGIVLTTLIFTVAQAVSSANKKMISDSEQETTNDSVLAYTQKSTEVQTTQAETQSQTQTQATQQETESQTQTEAQTTQAETQMPETQPPTQKALELGNDEVQIEIGSGYTATQVADMFLEAGIISDRDGFIGYMVDSGNSVKMRSGTHIVTKGDSFENLAAAITIR